jgi:hypothetical protein
MAPVTTPEKTPTDRLAEIAELLPKLLGEVTELADESGVQFVHLAQRARTNKRMIFWLTISVAFDIALSVLLGFGYGLLNDSNAQISTLTARLNTSQTVQRQRALCPLYTLFLSGDTPKARAAAPDKAKFDESYAVVGQGYAALDCDQFKGGAPTLGPTAKP